MHKLAPIYTEEKLWEPLWALVGGTGDFETAWRYHDLLVKHYPLELLEVYLSSLEQQGDRTNQRSDYEEPAYKMKKIIKDIPLGGKKSEPLHNG